MNDFVVSVGRFKKVDLSIVVKRDCCQNQCLKTEIKNYNPTWLGLLSTSQDFRLQGFQP